MSLILLSLIKGIVLEVFRVVENKEGFKNANESKYEDDKNEPIYRSNSLQIK